MQYVHWLRLIVFDQDFGFSVSNNIAVSSLIARRIVTPCCSASTPSPWRCSSPSRGRAPGPPSRPAVRSDRQRRVVRLHLRAGDRHRRVLKLLFVEHWHVFPRIAERVYPWDDLGAHVRNFTLPAVTLALPAAAVLTRLLRADLVLVLQTDFVLVAKAKGISPRRIMWRHALPNSMFTLLSSVGVQVGVDRRRGRRRRDVLRPRRDGVCSSSPPC